MASECGILSTTITCVYICSDYFVGVSKQSMDYDIHVEDSKTNDLYAFDSVGFEVSNITVE